MDRFDDIWRNRFDESELPKGDWNEPDAEIWDAIAMQLPVNKEKRRIVWFWWGLGLLAILAMLYFLFNLSSPTLSNVEQQNNVNKIGLSELDQKPIYSSETIINNKALTEKPAFKSVEKEVNKAKTIVKEPSIDAPKGLTLIDLNRSVKAIHASQKEAIRRFSSYKGRKNVKEVPVLHKLGPRFLEIEKTESPLPELSNELVKQQQTGIKKKVSIQVQSGIVYWKPVISQQYLSDLSPFDFSYSDDLGWHVNLGVNFAVSNKFQLFSGLQYSSIQSFSGHNSSLTYSTEQEVNANNDYIQNLATPYGPSELQFRLERSEAVSDAQTDLLVDFTTKHQIQNWSVPLGLSFSPMPQKKLSPNASIAFGVNYLAGVSNKVHQIETNHDAIQFDENSMHEFKAAKIEKWHYDLRFGAGLNYQFKNDLDLTLNYNWVKGLSNVFEQDNYKTQIQRHQVTLGLVKSINK